MRTIKMMMTGALLVLLGPVMHLLDVDFSGFHLLCWVVGIPLFLAGLLIPSDSGEPTRMQEELPQKECPACHKTHDFDYPKCPHCGYDGRNGEHP